MKIKQLIEEQTKRRQWLKETQAREIEKLIKILLKDLKDIQPKIESIKYSMGEWYFEGFLEGIEIDDNKPTTLYELIKEYILTRNDIDIKWCVSFDLPDNIEDLITACDYLFKENKLNNPNGIDIIIS